MGLVVSDDLESVRKEYAIADGRELPDKELHEGTVYHLVRRGKNYHAIAVILGSEITSKLMTHEAFHATCSMMEFLDTPVCRETEECCAYFIGWIAECIEKFKTDKR